MRRRGFSLVELLVVIGIISILIGLLLPTLSNMWASARMVTCQSNLRQLGQAMYIYAHENDGWLIPVMNDPTMSGGVRGFGTNVEPKERWPVKIFKFPLPNPETDDPADYAPKVIVCPSDQEPACAHTYGMNHPVAEHHCKLGNHSFGRLGPSEVIIAAEKITVANDYYFEPENGDFDIALDLFRHGFKRGSNYLYFDGHVAKGFANDVREGMDPWTQRDLPVTPPAP